MVEIGERVRVCFNSSDFVGMMGRVVGIERRNDDSVRAFLVQTSIFGDETLHVNVDELERSGGNIELLRLPAALLN